MTLGMFAVGLVIAITVFIIFLTVAGMFNRIFYRPKNFIVLGEDNDCARVFILGNVIEIRNLPGLVIYVASSDYYYAGEAEIDRNKKFKKCFYIHGFDLDKDGEKQIKDLHFTGVCFWFFGIIKETVIGRVAQVENLNNGCFRVDIIFE